MSPLPHVLVSHVHVQPSRSFALPSSQVSPESRTPSPQKALRQLVRHASGSTFEFATPASHSSGSWNCASPQYGTVTTVFVHVEEQPSPFSLFPSSHCSPAWIHLSPHTGLYAGVAELDDEDAAAGLLLLVDDAGTPTETDDGAEEGFATVDCDDFREDGSETDDAAAGTDDGAIDETEDDFTEAADTTTALDDTNDDAAETVDAADDDVTDADDPLDVADDDDAHATIVHVHPPVQLSPFSSHSGTEQTCPHCPAIDPVPLSHSSPTERDTMPSPHCTSVHSKVQFGPVPLRTDSSHSSPALTAPLPHNDVVCPVKRVAPIAATMPNSTSNTTARRRVSTGKRCRNRTKHILQPKTSARNRLDATFLVG